MEQTIKCPICGRPYKVYDGYAGDQSACPSCRDQAYRNMRGDRTWNVDEIMDTARRRSVRLGR